MDYDIVVGMLLSWAMAKFNRVAGRADTEVDVVLDAGMDRLHDAVAARLGDDPALATLEAEVEEFGETSELTRKRLARSLEKASADPEFVDELRALVPSGSTVINGGVHAETGSFAAGHVQGNVTFGQTPGPTLPDR